MLQRRDSIMYSNTPYYIMAYSKIVSFVILCIFIVSISLYIRQKSERTQWQCIRSNFFRSTVRVFILLLMCFYNYLISIHLNTITDTEARLFEEGTAVARSGEILLTIRSWLFAMLTITYYSYLIVSAVLKTEKKEPCSEL